MSKSHIGIGMLLWYSRAGPSEAVRHGSARCTKTESAGGEREKEEKGEREKKEEKEKRKRKEIKGEGSKRERCIRPIDVKHPLRTVKRL